MLIFNVPSLKNPFYSPIIEASRRTAKRFGYNLVVNENPLGTDLQSFIDLIRTSRAAGVILTNAIVPETVETIRQVVPVVTCCESATTAGVPYVTVDDGRVQIFQRALQGLPERAGQPRLRDRRRYHLRRGCGHGL